MEQDEFKGDLAEALRQIKGSPAPTDLKRQILDIRDANVRVSLPSLRRWPVLAGCLACLLLIVLFVKPNGAPSPEQQILEEETFEYLNIVFDEGVDDALLSDDFWTLEDVV